MHSLKSQTTDGVDSGANPDRGNLYNTEHV